MPERDDIAEKLEVTLAPYDAVRAEAVYEALAEYLVALWSSRRGPQPPPARDGSALPCD